MVTSHSQQLPQSLTEDEWNDLFDGVRNTYECSFETMTRQMTPQRYMILYTYVFNYCTKLGGQGQDLHSRATGGIVGIRNQSRMLPDIMYVKLSDYLKKHVKGLMASLELHGTGPEQLGAYAKLWRNYDFSSAVVNGIFAYFNTHRAKEDRSPADSAQQSVDIRQLAMKVWKVTVFDLVQENLTHAILRLIEANRNGEPPSRELLKEALESYIQLGYASLSSGEDDMEDAPIARLKVYNEYFEVPFLKATREYYKAEALFFIDSHSMLEYIRKVETRLDEEKVRCELYLHPTTMNPLDEVLCEVLIMEQLPAIQAEFEALLKSDVVEELARIYTILSRGNRAMEGVLTFTENFIRTKGLKAIAEIKDSAINDPDQYVQTILNVHKHMMIS